MSEINLSEKFPDLRPISAAPTLSTINGMGMRLVCRRDFDAETGSYVVTHAFCFLFIPLISVGAYRVIDAPGGGWYFLGRVPLSSLAKRFNFGLIATVLLAAGLGGWYAYTQTDDYQAAQRIEKADRLAADGKAGEAAKIYLDEMRKPHKHASSARNKLQQIVQSPTGNWPEAVAVFQIALDLQRQNDNLVPNLFEHVRKHAATIAEKSPEGALALLDVVAPLAPNPVELLAEQRRLLERLVAAAPNDVEFASRLADIYETVGELAKCEQLLLPLADRLGDRDGAAILGRIHFGKGKLDEAYALLEPYVRARLPQLQAAATNYESTLINLETQIIEQLRTEKAPGFDFDAAKKAEKAEQDAMIERYMIKRRQEDPGVNAAKKEFSAHRGVVPAALDLGMIILQRAQKLADPDARKRELEAAEQTLLSVRNVAGHSADYKLNLGQVYYWLGKPEEGKKLIDELLATTQRGTLSLLQVVRILREVGDVSEARKLAEEAYQNTADIKMKQQAAHVRGLMFKDIDDEVLWLERAGNDSPDVRASLSAARGHKAEQDGNRDDAARHYRAAIDVYDSLPENSTSLNNCALALFSLYQISHNQDDFVRGMDKLDRAIAMQPGDSILMHNAAGIILDAALRDLFGGKADFQRLRTRASFELVAFLYKDATEKDAVIAQLRKHPGVNKARGYCEKLMIVAPMRDDAYSMLAGLHGFMRDVDGLRSVRQKLETAKLDLAQETRDQLDFYEKKNDAKKIEDWRKSIERQEKVLNEVRAGGGLTFALAALRFNSARMGGVPLGIPVIDDDLVRLAEEAHGAAPSDGTTTMLAHALAFRAHRTLIKEDPAYAELANRTARSLGSTLINFTLGNPGSLRDKVLANADVKRVIALRMEQGKKLPNDRGFSTWALMVAAHPQEAAEMAAAIAKDEIHGLLRSIQPILSPLSSGVALDSYWQLRAAGKAAEADEVLQTFAKRGVPLPTPVK